MKIALYKSMQFGWDYVFEVDEYRESDKNYTRISEPLEVEFRSLPVADVVAKQLDAIDAAEVEARNKFQAALNALNDKRAELRALTVQP